MKTYKDLISFLYDDKWIKSSYIEYENPDMDLVKLYFIRYNTYNT